MMIQIRTNPSIIFGDSPMSEIFFLILHNLQLIIKTLLLIQWQKANV
mgnify:CR=1 FL=1